METALITGASEGIGFELAKVFAENKVNLVLVARNSEKLNFIAAQFVKDFFIEVEILVIDLTEPYSTQKIFDFCKSNNIRINYLVNNAGVGDYGVFNESSWERQKAMIDLNITALTSLTWLFLPEFLKLKEGRILNLSSTAAFLPGPRMSVYFATKAYVQSFSEAISAELEGTGITVTSLCPGPTQSKFSFSAKIVDDISTIDSKADNAYLVAKFGFDAMKKGTKTAIYGRKNRDSIRFLRFLSREKILQRSKRNMGL